MIPRLVLLKANGQYEINGTIEVAAPAEIKLTGDRTVKLVRVTPTYVLYREVPRVAS